MINGETGEIIAVYEERGSVHDLEVFKRSRTHFSEYVLLVGDKAYQGIGLFHSNSLTPYKKPKKSALTDYQKWFNSQIGSYRVHIEHINRRVKRFKILQRRYRNKQKKHSLRISLISGLHNYELRF